MLKTETIRKAFPHTKKSAYFNCASNGPLSTPAYEAQDKFYQVARMARIGRQVDVFEALDTIRKKAASIFKCKVSETGYGFNTTFGLNLAAFGLPLKKGDEVLLSDVEFPANIYPWLELRNRGVKIRFIKSKDGITDIDSIAAAITKKTRLLSISFVQFFNGYKNDLKAIGEICQANNIYFVIDCIQGAGCEPMDVKKWKVDIASAGGQKWLLSSQGSGIFYVSDRVKDIISPPWRSWLGVDWKCDWTNLNDFTRPFEPTARQFEMGTYPSAYVFSLAWSLEFLSGLGIGKISQHNHALIDLLISYLKSEPQFRVVSSLVKKHRSSIISFTTTKADIRQVHAYLLKKSVITALREGSIRVSVHLYNNTDDIKRLILALKHALHPGKIG